LEEQLGLGVVTQEEYQRKKQKLLEGLTELKKQLLRWVFFACAFIFYAFFSLSA